MDAKEFKNNIKYYIPIAYAIFFNHFIGLPLLCLKHRCGQIGTPDAIGSVIGASKTWSSGPVRDPAMRGSNTEPFWSNGALPIVYFRLQIDECAAPRLNLKSSIENRKSRDSIIASFQYSFYSSHKAKTLERPSGGRPKPAPRGPDGLFFYGQMVDPEFLKFLFHRDTNFIPSHEVVIVMFGLIHFLDFQGPLR